MNAHHTTEGGGFMHRCDCGRPERWFPSEHARDEWSRKHAAEHEKKEGKG